MFVFGTFHRAVLDGEVAWTFGPRFATKDGRSTEKEEKRKEQGNLLDEEEEEEEEEEENTGTVRGGGSEEWGRGLKTTLKVKKKGKKTQKIKAERRRG